MFWSLESKITKLENTMHIGTSKTNATKTHIPEGPRMNIKKLVT
jgi:hypothetical protein